MHLYAAWLLLLVSISSTLGGLIDLDEDSHDEAHLLSIFPANEDHHGALQQLLSDRSGCELLKYPQIEGFPVKVLCNGAEARDMKEILESLQLPFTSSRSELNSEEEEDTKSVDEEEPALNQHIKFDKNNRYDKIQKYLMKLARDYPDFVKLQFASSKQSYEGRNLTYLKIGTSPEKENTKLVWIDAGIHAREWASVSTVLYTIDHLVRVFRKQSGNDPLETYEEDIVRVDWLVMPLLNPDGYEYSHYNSSWSVRLWRKNRSPQAQDCIGVDLNRNFDVVGYGTGDARAVSNDSCKSTFIGTEKASELEVKMASEVVMANKDKIKVALSLHCYGSYILTPYAYTNVTPPDSDRIVDFGNRLYKAIKTVNPQRKFTVGPSGKLFLYFAGGSSLDYYKATAGIPFVATIELPGNYTNGTLFPAFYGFQTPKDQRLLISKEIWATMPELARTALAEPKGDD